MDAGPSARGAGSHPALRRRLRLLLVLAVVLLAVVVIAGVEAFHQAGRMSGSATVQTAGFVAPSDSAPAPFSLPVLAGAPPGATAAPRTITMAALRGEPVVLNMWSSSCSVCKEETPAMEHVSRGVGQAVRFVGVDTLDQRATALAFLRRYHVSYLQLFDPGEQLGSAYGIPGLPVTVFVSAQGKVVGEYLGALSVRTLTHYLHTLFGVHGAAN